MTGHRPNNGGKRLHHCPRKMTHDQAREALVMYQNGALQKVIAYQFGVSRYTVARSIRRLEQ